MSSGMRAQVALEYMVLAAIALALIVPLFLLSSSNAADGLRVTQARDSVRKIAAAADLVNSLGEGSVTTVSYNFPSGVVESGVSGRRVLIRVSTTSGVSDVFANSKANLFGPLPSTQGVQTAKLFALPDGSVQIGGLDATPTAFPTPSTPPATPTPAASATPTVSPSPSPSPSPTPSPTPVTISLSVTDTTGNTCAASCSVIDLNSRNAGLESLLNRNNVLPAAMSDIADLGSKTVSDVKVNVDWRGSSSAPTNNALVYISNSAGSQTGTVYCSAVYTPSTVAQTIVFDCENNPVAGGLDAVAEVNAMFVHVENTKNNPFRMDYLNATVTYQP